MIVQRHVAPAHVQLGCMRNCGQAPVHLFHPFTPAHAYQHAIASCSCTAAYCSDFKSKHGVVPLLPSIPQALVPLAIPAVQSPTNAARLTILSAAGLYGLLPLLFRPQEYLPKMAITLGYLVVLHALLRYVHRKALQKQRNGALLSWLQRVYMLGFVGLEVLVNGVHPMVLGTRLPFLPLMMTSVYCALGVTWVWGSMLLDRTSW